EGTQQNCPLIGRIAACKANSWQHRRLLCACRQWPCRRTAHERDEFASFHSIELHPIPHKPGPGAARYRIDDDQSAGVRMILHTECRAAPKTASRFESGAPQSTDVNEHVLDASCVPKPVVSRCSKLAFNADLHWLFP